MNLVVTIVSQTHADEQSVLFKTKSSLDFIILNLSFHNWALIGMLQIFYFSEVFHSELTPKIFPGTTIQKGKEYNARTSIYLYY